MHCPPLFGSAPKRSSCSSSEPSQTGGESPHRMSRDPGMRNGCRVLLVHGNCPEFWACAVGTGMCAGDWCHQLALDAKRFTTTETFLKPGPRCKLPTLPPPASMMSPPPSLLLASSQCYWHKMAHNRQKESEEGKCKPCSQHALDCEPFSKGTH